MPARIVSNPIRTSFESAGFVAPGGGQHGPTAVALSGAATGMNDQRYKSYLFISRVLKSDLFSALEREVLTDAAEGLLLTREPDSAHIEGLELNAKAALDGMSAARRIHGTTAAEIFERIRDCGPPPLAIAA
jgi:hypothetical protein